VSTKSIYFKLIVAKNISLFSAEWIKDISLSVIYQFSYFFGFSNQNIFVGPVESKQLRRGDMRRPENEKSKITNQFWIFEKVKWWNINCNQHKTVSLLVRFEAKITKISLFVCYCLNFFRYFRLLLIWYQITLLSSNIIPKNVIKFFSPKHKCRHCWRPRRRPLETRPWTSARPISGAARRIGPETELTRPRTSRRIGPMCSRPEPECCTSRFLVGRYFYL
jgi:hypothetical protein